MNTDQLTKANAIQQDIERLKSSLSEMLKGRIFTIEEYHTGPYMRSTANPFLADLEVKTRSFATNAITKRIEELETEFKNL